MSVVTRPNSHKANVSPDIRNGIQAANAASFTGGLRKAIGWIGRLLVSAYEAIAEARLQKTRIEAELYRDRYLHSSKNDDDLPVVR